MKKAMGFALAVLATAVGGDDGTGRPEGCGNESGVVQLQEHDHAAVHHTADRRCRLPRAAEQASWAKYAVKTLAPQYGLKVKLALGDTPVEAGPAPALALAQKYIANKSVVAVLGPSTSGDAGATAKPFFAAGIAAGITVGDTHRPDDMARRAIR